MARDDHGCQAKGVIGFREQSLIYLFGDGDLPSDAWVDMELVIFDDCINIKDKDDFGELCGKELDDCALKLVEKEKVSTMPTRIVSDATQSLSSAKLNIKNFGGQLLSVSSAANAKKKVKRALLHSFGLHGKENEIVNIYKADRLLKLKDTAL